MANLSADQVNYLRALAERLSREEPYAAVEIPPGTPLSALRLVEPAAQALRAKRQQTAYQLQADGFYELPGT